MLESKGKEVLNGVVEFSCPVYYITLHGGRLLTITIGAKHTAQKYTLFLDAVVYNELAPF